MPAASLTTEAGLKAYLATKNITPTSITLLTGGTANYVYRVTLADGSTSIYKHAAPYLHMNTNFAFDPTRMDYEDRTLEILPSLQKTDSNVQAAKWYSYDKEEKLLCIEDGGEWNLKTAYPDPKLDVEQIGRDLARWLAGLHTTSTTTSLSLTDEQDLKANNPVGVGIYRHSYRNLHTALSKYGHDPKFAERIDEEFGSKLATDNECVCHGDFWPGNVLVKFEDSEEAKVNLTVVDLEMVRRGTSATDVAQFVAEAFLLDRFRGGRGLHPVFLNTYARARETAEAEGGIRIGREWIKRVAIHWGVHIAFWPTGVQWTDREGTQNLVDIGIAVLQAAIAEDWRKLRETHLFVGVADVWTALWDRGY
ncbi:kinase-like domain-containing protein [Lophiotrema nucula]|uniref:Kinase-like domain-containing protein n=1 Tax=Lophiotrema nucula TaxID=690887 RepID=A0A6A5Z8M2_9PLEO|nr:kinase-like domain-containing protein [Lophiotrema nucula]